MVEQTLNAPRKIKKGKHHLAVACIALALILSSFTVGLNTSKVFAMTMSDIPIIGDIAKVLTFKDYEIHSDVINAEVSIPAVEGLGNKKFEKKINNEIQSKMDLVLEEAEQRALEYKDAYIATGGKEEGFRPVDVFIDYEVKHASKDILSFVIIKGETLGSAYNEAFYYNIDLNSNDNLTLVDFFGDNYVDYISKEIAKQIEERIANGEGHGFFTGEMGFHSIKEDQNFYINKDGKVTVVFAKYEIASGASGSQEFILE